jgi:RNA polymerase-binding transcription factor DksA
LADSGTDPGSARELRLRQLLLENAAQLADLERQHADVVAASVDSNADDEHDPEGATIAFERQQLSALTAQLLRTRDDLLAALEDGEAYGTCRSCGGEIGAERLAARPSARTCIGCASGPRGGRGARAGRETP